MSHGDGLGVQRLEDLSCLPQHTAEVDLKGRVRRIWLQRRTQMVFVVFTG